MGEEVSGKLMGFTKKGVLLFKKLYRKVKLWAFSLLRVSYRLQHGLHISVRERSVLARKIQVQKKALPLFSDKRVLCWEPAPFPVHIAISCAVGTALSLRGCRVEQVICDGTPVACIGREIVNSESFLDWTKRCSGCYRACKNEAVSFGLKTIALGDLIDSDKLQELRRVSQETNLSAISSYVYKGINVGLYAASSLTRYYKGKMIEPEESLLREYFFGALLTTETAINKIDSFKPAAIYMSHGIYTSWGPALRIALQRKIPVIKMGGGYIPSCTYFRKIVSGNNAHQGMLSDSGWELRRAKPLTAREKEILDSYVRKRYTQGSGDISVIAAPKGNEEAILEQLQIDRSKPIWCIFANLGWDASLDVAPMAFSTPSEWLVETMKAIIDNSNVQWLVKIHPAEKTTETVQGAEDTIRQNFQQLPPNMKIIPPDTKVNTYDIFTVIDGGVTCLGNTTGLELSMLGKPMIIAGESLYAKRGFSYDGLTRAKYLDFLKRVPDILPLSKEQQDDAYKLAYSYFIQRQIPLRMFNVGSNGRPVSFDWRKVESLLPGRDPVVDMICERFFVGEDFMLPDNIVHSMYDYAVEPEVLP